MAANHHQQQPYLPEFGNHMDTAVLFDTARPSATLMAWICITGIILFSIRNVSPLARNTITLTLVAYIMSLSVRIYGFVGWFLFPTLGVLCAAFVYLALRVIKESVDLPRLVVTPVVPVPAPLEPHEERLRQMEAQLRQLQDALGAAGEVATSH